MQPKDYKARMRKEMDDLAARIVNLRIKADRSGPDRKAALISEIEIAVSKKQELERKIESIDEASVDDWQELMDGISSAAKDLQSKLDSALGK